MRCGVAAIVQQQVSARPLPEPGDVPVLSTLALATVIQMSPPRQSDGDLLTYGDGVLHHFTAALETALTAARTVEPSARGCSIACVRGCSTAAP